MALTEEHNPINVVPIDLGVMRPSTARLLIAQAYWETTHWRDVKGLVFPSDLEQAQNYLERILAQARQATVDMVLFPELSIPEESLSYIQTWSEQTGSIVIAGSHYTKTKKGYISRCPIVVAGKIHFTEKLIPAPAEVSPIAGEGLTPGNNVVYFRNTSIGNFGVLICSDYLDLETKGLLSIEDLDLLCVPAFQRNSEMYHVRMNLDCEESDNGLYIAYANTICGDFGDGRSAFFGLMDNLFLNKLEKAGYTDREPSLKICELAEDQTYMVLEINLHHKKPFAKRTVHTKPNIQLIHVAGAIDTETEIFTQAIGHQDERYRRIKELFVAPSEYDSLLEILDKSKLLFITGDPGIGKTYTAVRLLRHYFDQGYEPVWYAGLEKAERLNQRQILENFIPRNRQIIYFEDPFGRTVFERRDTISRTFGPLIDHMKGVDARVIITSRREVFEQFAQETLSFVQLAAFTEEMNVVKPSYSAAALTKILHILAENAKWYQHSFYRELVLQQITEGKLSTPLAIRDFTFSTESVEPGDILLERLRRRGVEEKELFAEEIEACDVHTKLTLCLIFLFGSQSLATLASWFNQTASFIDPVQLWNGTAPFFEEVRVQSGYRIEQYGSKATVLRFIHPYYEEAFAATAERDPVTYDIISSVVKFVARKKAQISISSVTRHWVKYPELTFKLLSEIVPVLKAQGSLEDICRFGLKVLDIHSHSSNPRHIDLIQSVCTIGEAMELINKEVELHVVTQGLRFLYNYGQRTGGANWKSLVYKIDWNSLAQKWEAESSFSKLLANWEWSHRLDQRSIKRFIDQLSKTDLLAKFSSLNATEQLRFIKIAGMWVSESELYDLVGKERSPSRRIQVEHWIEADPDKSYGVIIDDGAEAALRKGWHLLPVGVTEVKGDFDREDVISIFNATGECIGAGIASYEAEDIQLIKGKHSSFINELLSHDYGESVIRAKSYLLFQGDEF
jgi:predicted amidohydrolase/predicted ribosome-associated RNA-binding protein Tma20